MKVSTSVGVSCRGSNLGPRWAAGGTARATLAARGLVAGLVLVLWLWPHGEPRRRRAVLARLPRPVPHHLRVDGARDAVVNLHVQLGEGVGCVDGRVADVTEGGGLHDVPDHELPDRLVLGDGFAAVDAADVADVATTVLRAAVVAALRSHLCFR